MKLLKTLGLVLAVLIGTLLATGCTTTSQITYPVKSRGYIVTDTPCPQSPDERLIYRESDNELACYHTRKLQNNTYIVATFNGREVWILFYKE